MRSDDRGRLDKVMDGLMEASEEARKDTRRRMNDWGLVEIREPSAPDPNEYPEEDIDRYLFDLHEWAREQYAERVAELQEIADLDVEAYPELGADRRKDRNERANQSEQIVEVGRALARVDETRDWLDQIEDEWNNR